MNFEALLAVFAPDLLDDLVQEHRFHPRRRWRFDYAFLRVKLAIEIEGGTYAYGRHNRPSGYRNDCEKYNAAVLDGWAILRYTTEMLSDDPERCIAQVRMLYEQRLRTFENL